MKKLLILIPALVITFSACRKNRSCVCSQGGTEIGTANYINVKKSEAKTYCAALQDSYGTNSTVTCVIK